MLWNPNTGPILQYAIDKVLQVRDGAASVYDSTSTTSSLKRKLSETIGWKAKRSKKLNRNKAKNWSFELEHAEHIFKRNRTPYGKSI
jgi:hypothetical protein